VVGLSWSQGGFNENISKDNGLGELSNQDFFCILLKKQGSFLHINPNVLNDIPSKRAELVQAMNLIDSLLQQNRLLPKQNQEVKDEINRLKGEKGKPNILPNSKKSVDISSQRRNY